MKYILYQFKGRYEGEGGNHWNPRAIRYMGRLPNKKVMLFNSRKEALKYLDNYRGSGVHYDIEEYKGKPANAQTFTSYYGSELLEGVVSPAQA
tara:strand:+ start:988 stop:1266 length:279 start_codon:yes stop_codon:yes gene_type:complete